MALSLVIDGSIDRIFTSKMQMFWILKGQFRKTEHNFYGNIFHGVGQPAY